MTTRSFFVEQMTTIHESRPQSPLDWKYLLMEDDVLHELFQDIPMVIRNQFQRSLIPDLKLLDTGDEYTLLARILANYATRPEEEPFSFLKPRYSRFKSHDLMSLGDVPSLLLKEVTVWKATLRKDANMWMNSEVARWRNQLAVLCARMLAMFHQLTMDAMTREGIPDFAPESHQQTNDERLRWNYVPKKRGVWVSREGEMWDEADHNGLRPWDDADEESSSDESDSTVEDDQMHGVQLQDSAKTAESPSFVESHRRKWFASLPPKR
jgi:hypothetical protein